MRTEEVGEVGRSLPAAFPAEPPSLPLAERGAQVARTPPARAAAPPAVPAPAAHLLDPGPGGEMAAVAGPCPLEKPPRSRRCAGRALLFQAGAG